MVIAKYNNKALETNNQLIGMDFSKMSWARIKRLCKANKASTYFSIGDTKTITGTDGNSYTIRVVDLQEGRYEYASDNAYNHAVFEMVVCLPTTYAMADNASDYFYETDLFDSINSGAIYNILPSDLRDELEDMHIKCFNNRSTYAITDTTCKVFITALGEQLPRRTGSIISTYEYETTSYKTNQYLGGFDYYQQETDTPEDEAAAQARRQKCEVGTTTPVSHWTRTIRRASSSGHYYMEIDDDGNSQYVVGTTNKYVALTFAF